MARIFAVELRTTEVGGARAFYGAVLGRDDVPIVPIEPQALARGARPLWLGYIDVAELEPAVAAFVARGAVQLGPKRTTSDGAPAAMLRDPGGAVVGLAEARPDGGRAALELAWCQLNVAGVGEVKRCYRELFGWWCHEPEELATTGVVNHPFAWQSGGERAGAMADIAARPGVHPHWLFHFPVESLGAAVERVRARGGVTLPPLELPSGVRVAVCDDPQGAAFALVERGA